MRFGRGSSSPSSRLASLAADLGWPRFAASCAATTATFACEPKRVRAVDSRSSSQPPRPASYRLSRSPPPGGLAHEGQQHFAELVPSAVEQALGCLGSHVQLGRNL